MDTNKYLKRLQRFEHLVREEKVALINAVKNQNCIWNNKTKEYSDQMVVKRAWETVAEQLNKDGEIFTVIIHNYCKCVICFSKRV